MDVQLPVEVRLAIADVLGRYLFAVDMGDAEAVLRQFVPDAVVSYDDGRRFTGPEGLRVFAASAIGGPEARGRMHFNQPLFADWVGRDVLHRSYLLVPQCAGDGSVEIVALRYVEDRFTHTDQGWRIAERAIFCRDGRSKPRDRGEAA
ncbi:nuclear transport factor 2 family protein [Novosphingobium sp. KN65.2]|uniref:nuclear transport factor 2 family protein n=1 Tax=Novosphingobium sp. KN65.2 TaxID=1478134 RepID=UPI0005E41A12|nr:nuclear transport factor 2 family protein [Novosphingobium sp. KN65.2]CDO35245.1 conserved hypothetical protein [Novosphingobium sp. KN65.2]